MHIRMRKSLQKYIHNQPNNSFSLYLNITELVFTQSIRDPKMFPLCSKCLENKFHGLYGAIYSQEHIYRHDLGLVIIFPFFAFILSSRCTLFDLNPAQT